MINKKYKQQNQPDFSFKSIREMSRQDIYTLYLIAKSKYKKLTIYGYYDMNFATKGYYVAENISLLINIIKKKIEIMNSELGIIKLEAEIFGRKNDSIKQKIDDITSEIKFYNTLLTELQEMLSNIKETLVIVNKTYQDFSIDYTQTLVNNGVRVYNYNNNNQNPFEEALNEFLNEFSNIDDDDEDEPPEYIDVWYKQ